MRTETLVFVAVAAGSALGGAARYVLSGVVARAFGETFPWGTLVVNVLGSFLIGFVATVTGPDGRLLVSPVLRQFWMPGIFGGFTTFSSFSLQTLSLVSGRRVVARGRERRALDRPVPRGRVARGRSRRLGQPLKEDPCRSRPTPFSPASSSGEADRGPGGHPLYEAVVLRAREMHLAGATVLRGPMGFGRNSHLHTAKILRLSADLPIVVEIVDAEAKVRAFLEAIEPMMGSGLVTLERVSVMRYGAPRAE